MRQQDILPHSTNSRRVDFLVAGTQKGGTTTLYRHLESHPQICVPPNKELHFFDDEDRFAIGEPDYSPYHRCFDPTETEVTIGEVTPVYMFWNTAAKRIWDYNPEMKLILLLRNPITRAFSHWHMEFSKKNETMGFLDAITSEQERAAMALPLQHRVFSYISRGFYTEQLNRLWQYFPRDNLLILKSDWLRTSTGEALTAIARFLDVEPFPDTTPMQAFVQNYAAQMTEHEHRILRDTFEPEISRLEQLLSWDCSTWLDFPGAVGHAQ